MEVLTGMVMGQFLGQGIPPTRTVAHYIAVVGTAFNVLSYDAFLGRELNPSPPQSRADMPQTRVISLDKMVSITSLVIFLSLYTS